MSSVFSSVMDDTNSSTNGKMMTAITRIMTMDANSSKRLSCFDLTMGTPP